MLIAMAHPTPEVEPVFAIATVSDSRFEKMMKGESFADRSGSEAKRIIEEKGFKVLGPVLLPNNLQMIEGFIEHVTGRGYANIVLLIGGTGVSQRDVSVEAVEEVSDKLLPGFGEAFRAVTREESIEKSVFTRAAAGTYGDSLIFAVPGNPEAVSLALERIILPSVKHLLGELVR